MRRARAAFILGAVVFSPLASAQELQGVHLLAGAGLNSSSLRTVRADRAAGVGLNFRTDVGYYFPAGLGIELGTNVNFNRVEGQILLWDTLLTLGVRSRLDFIPHPEETLPFGKVFGGYGPAVMFFRGDHPSGVPAEIDRAQLEGPVAGASLGLSFATEAEQIWFIELTGTWHWFREIAFVTKAGEVPIVVEDRVVAGRSTLSSVYVTVGFVIF
jgi:hypothetical protein